MSQTSTKSLNVAILGGGMSGLCVGYFLKQAGIDDFTIYEKADDVGGTWHLHSYPGLHCDVPSHVYSYSFYPNPDWSQLFSPREEIRDYFYRMADDTGLRPHIRTGCGVATAEYRDRRWHLTLENGEQVSAGILVNAMGVLYEPSWPNVPGIDAFDGPSFHSARWDSSVDLKGKRVAIIGSAASAVQIVPSIAPDVAELKLFQRTPNWVVPRKNFNYPGFVKALFRRFPALQRLHRKMIMAQTEFILRAFQKQEKDMKKVKKMAFENLGKGVGDAPIRKQLIPDFEPGCKRLLLTDDFYPALMRDNVELINEGVSEINAGGVLSESGRQVDADVLIYCTGYKLPNFHGPVETTGPDGVKLEEVFSVDPECYKGMAIPGFPNYFLINGPNGPTGYSAVIWTAEFEAEYLARLIVRMREEGLDAVEIPEDLNRRYNDRIQEKLQGMTWAGSCNSYYHNPETGHVSIFYPGSVEEIRQEYQIDPLREFVPA